MTDPLTNHPQLVDLLQERALRQPQRLAYTFLVDGEEEGERWTYADLDRRARAVAAVLQRSHRPGDRALLLYSPGLDFLAGFYGCLYAGLIAIPAPPPDAARLKRSLPRLQTIVQDSEASVVLGTAGILELLDKVDGSLPAVAGLVRFATEAVADAEAESWRRPDLGPDTVAYLQYTSGSTSAPKGVVVAHRHLLHNLSYNRRRWLYDDDSVAATWMPYFHDYGLVEGLMQPAYSGVPAYVLSPLAFLRRPLRWLQAIDRYRVSHSAAPNFGYDHCVERIPEAKREGLDLSSWRVASCGAEVIRAETLERFADAFAPHGFERRALFPAYGLAEATLLVTTRPAAGPEVRVLALDPVALEGGLARPVSDAGATARQVVSCGSAEGDVEVVIADPQQRRRLALGEVGEVWISSPSVAGGYWRRPEDDDTVFRCRLAGEEESGRTYLRTGDLGFLDDGELFVSGRMKDLIIIRGSNHFPQDLELTVEHSHAVLRTNCCAAFSVEDDGEERLVLAAEVERGFRTEQLAEVAGAIRQAVAETHDVEVWCVTLLRRGSILKTSSGKIQRAGCRRAFLDGDLEIVAEQRSRPAPVSGSATALATAPATAPATATAPDRRREVHEWLLERLAARLGVAPGEVDPTQPFARYGLDSAAAVSLAGELEELLGVELPETLLYQHPTIERLAAHLGGKRPQAGPKLEAPRRVAAHPAADREPLAVVGVGCRFPGATGPEAYWTLLADGVDAIGEVPVERWDAAALYAPEPATPGKSNTRWGGFLAAVDRFDAEFFDISPREAARMDPQQRLVLEVAWEALEHAGLVPAEMAGSATGVFVGISTNDYRQMQLGGDPRRIDAYAGTGNALSIAANRLSYALDLRGPSLSVDTACSSSLVAVHSACRSLRDGECDLALAGGVNLMLTPEWTLTFSQARMMAADGRCKTFDAAADGYVRGEGCGVVVLKRLSDAERDGDRILALVLGSAVNQDGRSNGLTAPNGGAQEEVLRRALAAAGVEPREVGWIEAHGTGTPLGDPIEVEALDRVLGEDRPAERPFWLGSAKTNIGHLEAAAGVAGLIKVVLGLDHGAVPPHLHFREPNPRLDWQRLPLRVPTRLEPWVRGAQRRVAGVSSFGFGGTNSHVVLAEAPATKETGLLPAEAPRSELLVLSARGQSALRRLAEAQAERLEEADLAGWPAGWRALCTAASRRRGHFDQRLALVAEDSSVAVAALRAHAAGGAAAVTTGRSRGRGRGGIAFLFTGQGAQHAGMGRRLYDTEPLFRETFDRCAKILGERLEYPLTTVLFGDGWETELLHQTAYTQPCLFALEYSLAQMWRGWGIEPDAVLGHSTGELAAACVAGVFSLEDALELVCERARLMQELPEGGAMLAVLSGEARVEEILGARGIDVAIAAVNAADKVVLSGSTETIQAAARALAAEDVETRRVRVSHAFQSPLIEPVLDRFESFARRFRFKAPSIPLISNVDGLPFAPGRVPDAAYWRRHAVSTVRFHAGVAALRELGCDVFLEVGPHGSLAKVVAASLAGTDSLVLASMWREEDSRRTVLEALGQLYVRGWDPRWEAVFPQPGGGAAALSALPTYPFERARHWFDRTPAPVATQGAAHAFPWLGRRLEGAEGKVTREVRVAPASYPFLDHHRVQSVMVLPAACYLEMALEAAERDLGAGPWEVADLLVNRAVFLPEGGGTGLRFELDTDGAWRVLSLAADGEAERASEGRLIPAQGQEPESLDREGCLGRLAGPRPGADYYRHLRRLGLDYGPCHQGIAEIWAGDGEALARLETPAELRAEAEDYRLHPALLDAAWQTLAAAIPEELTADGRPVPWLPVALAGFRVFAPPPAELWCRAVLVDRNTDGARLVAVVELFDGAGRPVAACRDLVVQRLEPGGSRTVELETGFFDLRWNALPALPQPSTVPAAGSWVVLGDDVVSAMAVATELRGRGARVVLSAGVDETERWREPRRLARWLAEQPADLAGAVLLWRGHGEVEEATGIAAAVHLVQAMALSERRVRIHLVTRGAVDAGAETTQMGEGEVASAALWGFGRALAQEAPELWGAAIDLDPALDLETSAAALADELLTAEPLGAGARSEDQVALRAGGRLGARLVAIEAPSASPPALRRDGAYLITGGFGDLGLATAGWLASAGAGHLVLLGRRSAEEVVTGPGGKARRRALEELRRRGVGVETVALDVADADALDSWYRERPASAPPIRGVVHAAGAVELSAIGSLDDIALAAVLRPKVAGALNLHRLFPQPGELDFFVLFSSISAVLGSPQLASYAAANAFLDALATLRRRRGFEASSLRWPAWQGIGMAARQGVEPPRGMAALAPAAGLEILGRCLGAGRELPPAPMMLAVDWRRWAQAHPSAAAVPALRGLVPAPSAGPAAGPAASLADGSIQGSTDGLAATPAGGTEDYLAALVAEVLELPAASLDRARPLNRMGLDSLMAVEVKNRVEEDLGVALSVVQFLQGPSVAELAARLDEELGAGSSTVPSPGPSHGASGAATNGSSSLPPQAQATSAGKPRISVSLPAPVAVEPVDPGTARRLLDTLDDLSDSEVHVLLNQMLAAQGAPS